MIGFDRFDRLNLVCDQVMQEFNKCQFMLGLIDLPAKLRDTTTIFFRIVNQLERIKGRSR